MTGSRRGFSLLELLTAVVLFALVSTGIVAILHSTVRAHRHVTAYVELSNTLRTAVNVLRANLVELDAGDSAGSDILRLGRGVLEYRAMKGVMFVCDHPDTTGGSITLFDTDSLRFPSHLGPPTPTRDELMIFASGSGATFEDDHWMRRSVLAVASVVPCGGGEPGYAIALSGGPLAGVRRGAPVRIVRRSRIRTYVDSNGNWWLGLQGGLGGGGWSRVQPVVGPLVASGLQLTYYDRAGTRTDVPSRVSRLGLHVAGMAGGLPPVRSLTTVIALRNNRHHR